MGVAKRATMGAAVNAPRADECERECVRVRGGHGPDRAVVVVFDHLQRERGSERQRGTERPCVVPPARGARLGGTTAAGCVVPTRGEAAKGSTKKPSSESRGRITGQ